MDVLIVEDESEIAKSIQNRLSEEGLNSSWISDFESVNEVFQKPAALPRVVVLDRLIGCNDTLELVPKLRKQNPNTGILILSTINSPMEKAAALENGADDYMGKPFSMTEFIARIRALERRSMRTDQRSFFVLGDLKVDVLSRAVTCSDARLNLTNKEFLILKLLISNPGRVFSKSHIYESVWDINSNFETNVIEATINNMRRKFEDVGCKVKIKNTRQVGYWIEA